eukprot:s1542_g24.t1
MPIFNNCSGFLPLYFTRFALKIDKTQKPKVANGDVTCAFVRRGSALTSQQLHRAQTPAAEPYQCTAKGLLPL